MNMATEFLFTIHFFFVTSEWAQKARVLHFTWLERLTKDKNPRLLGPFIHYEENEVLGIECCEYGHSVPIYKTLFICN
jgi:hypothetical protein